MWRGIHVALNWLMASHKNYRKTEGFTLVEVMIVMAIISLLASIAVPNYIRSRKRAQAAQVKADLRMLDDAIQFYVIEHGKSDTSMFAIGDLLPYTKAGSRLALSSGSDIFGNAFVLNPPVQIPRINPTTYAALSDVTPVGYWSPYLP
jgi:prepilin-type N-terminal cleavage/methylation domain-containing protein